MARKRVMIMGAAGMDYHAFNTVFRDNPDFEVVGFTMAPSQNLGTVEGQLRSYPAKLAGKLYPNGIPTFHEADLAEMIKLLKADQVVLAYSDISHEDVMHLASQALVAGADFRLLSPRALQLKAQKPVIAICAVRTGCGKSQTSRRVYEILKQKGVKAVAVREPMPYGDLEKQVWQRFASYDDLMSAGVTIEEREEYEPYIENGMVIYAGCDYSVILTRAQNEADVIVWDGGNNEIAFFVPDLLIVLVDPLRPGHETLFHPGEVNLRQADVVVVNKQDSARREDISAVKKAVRKVNPNAVIIDADSPIEVAKPDEIKGKRVLVVEDGPTVTHGGMGWGAGRLAAEKFGAAEIINPRPFATGSLAKAMDASPHLKSVLPAMGYSELQLGELEQAINSADCDLVVSGTPIDLNLIIKARKPIIRVKYRLQEKSKPDLDAIVTDLLRKKGLLAR
ncbi:MAG: cyclic 2,3-diphosphoglycerate synthase [candidate division WOR-3 bacterium]